MKSVSKQRLGKHVPEETNVRNKRREVVSMFSTPRSYVEDIYVDQFIWVKWTDVKSWFVSERIWLPVQLWKEGREEMAL
jgi:hypothetical protein